MNARIQFTPQAAEDLDAIWWVIAEDNRDAADRVEREILANCHRLAKHPRMERSGRTLRRYRCASGLSRDFLTM